MKKRNKGKRSKPRKYIEPVDKVKEAILRKKGLL